MSFEPRHGKTPASRHLVLKPDRSAAGRRFGSQPIGPLNATADRNVLASN
jgi:hypothetical protein